MAQTFIRYGVGLDISQKQMAASFVGITEEEIVKVRSSRKFDNTPSGFVKLRAWISKHAKQSELPLRLLMEVTGVYHEKLLYQLHQWGFYVSLELGKRTKRYAQSLGLDSKTDPMDAFGLAHMAVSRKLKEWEPVTKDAYAIRQLLRVREEVMQTRVAFQNRLSSALSAHHIDNKVVQSLKRTIKFLLQEEKKLEQKAIESMKKDEQLWRKINMITKSLPGVGILTMLKVVVETNGFQAFTSAKQLTRYAGYDVIEKQSGTYKGKTKISKQGNARVRKAMYMSAMSHVRSTNSPIKQLYNRVIQRTGLAKKAQTATQRKLLCLIFALWKSNKPYDPNYQNTHQPKNQPENASLQNESSSDQRPELHEIAPA